MTVLHRIAVRDPDEMRRLGERLGGVAHPGDIFLLSGQLGAGKTTFVQGLAAGLGVAEPVSSPSFVIEARYRGRLGLNHLDLFRLESLSPDLRSQLEEHLFSEDVSVVEWPALLPQDVQDAGIHLSFHVEEPIHWVTLVEDEHSASLCAHLLTEFGRAGI